jgi:hypothetical protein
VIARKKRYLRNMGAQYGKETRDADQPDLNRSIPALAFAIGGTEFGTVRFVADIKPHECRPLYFSVDEESRQQRDAESGHRRAAHDKSVVDPKRRTGARQLTTFRPEETLFRKDRAREPGHRAPTGEVVVTARGMRGRRAVT